MSAVRVRPTVSVVIALFNRVASVEHLLSQLAVQTMAPQRFEVIVVDDGSTEPAAACLLPAHYPFTLVVLRQDNAGPAAARHAGILAARADLIVIVDDDMRVGPGFLDAHGGAHDAAAGARVVLGRIRAPTGARLRLFERFQLAQLDKLAHRAAQQPSRLRGGEVYSGNVSFPRAQYFDIGGFDPALRLSEDAELGIRFERAGVTIAFSEAAWSEHASDHAATREWVKRSIAYGVADSAIAHKHAGVAAASPWRFLFLVNPVSRNLLAFAVVAPRAGRWLAESVLALARSLGALGMDGLAMPATTLAYGLFYFVGVRAAAGSRSAAFAALRAYLVSEHPSSLGRMGLIAKCVADIAADHAMLLSSDARYRPQRTPGGILGDAIQRIGFQMLIAIRLMRLCSQLRLRLLARLLSRAIRHVYAADVHWDAALAPGIVIVHGVGLVIGHDAQVATGCVLFQHVTLGESIHPISRRVGCPSLEANVHVAPGAVVLGPIVIGRDSKIAANSVVTESVPARSVVESAGTRVRSRDAAPVTSDALPEHPAREHA